MTKHFFLILVVFAAVTGPGRAQTPLPDRRLAPAGAPVMTPPAAMPVRPGLPSSPAPGLPSAGATVPATPVIPKVDTLTMADLVDRMAMTPDPQTSHDQMMLRLDLLAKAAASLNGPVSAARPETAPAQLAAPSLARSAPPTPPLTPTLSRMIQPQPPAPAPMPPASMMRPPTLAMPPPSQPSPPARLMMPPPRLGK